MQILIPSKTVLDSKNLHPTNTTLPPKRYLAACRVFRYCVFGILVLLVVYFLVESKSLVYWDSQANSIANFRAGTKLIECR